MTTRRARDDFGRGPVRLSQKGFTLVEALLAAVLGLVGVGIYVGLNTAQSKTDYGLVARLSAMDDCRVAMELLRMRPFSQLAPTPGPVPIASMPWAAPAGPGTPGYAPGAWTATPGGLLQKNFTYVPVNAGKQGHVMLTPGQNAPTAPSAFMALDSARLAYTIGPHLEHGAPVPQALQIEVVATWREADSLRSFRLVTVRTDSEMEGWP